MRTIYCVERVSDGAIVGASALDFQCATWDATIESTITQGDMNDAFGIHAHGFVSGLEHAGYRLTTIEAAP